MPDGLVSKAKAQSNAEQPREIWLGEPAFRIDYGKSRGIAVQLDLLTALDRYTVDFVDKPDDRLVTAAFGLLFRNEGKQSIQLKQRQWSLKLKREGADGNVINANQLLQKRISGQQPWIEPGGTFHYLSGVAFAPNTPDWNGVDHTMRGRFASCDKTGQSSDIKVKFSINFPNVRFTPSSAVPTPAMQAEFETLPERMLLAAEDCEDGTFKVAADNLLLTEAARLFLERFALVQKRSTVNQLKFDFSSLSERCRRVINVLQVVDSYLLAGDFHHYKLEFRLTTKELTRIATACYGQAVSKRSYISELPDLTEMIARHVFQAASKHNIPFDEARALVTKRLFLIDGGPAGFTSRAVSNSSAAGPVAVQSGGTENQPESCEKPQLTVPIGDDGLPLLYAKRSVRSENAEQFILRVYGRGDPAELERIGLTQWHLGKLDPDLYRAWSLFKHRHAPSITIPTKNDIYREEPADVRLGRIRAATREGMAKLRARQARPR